MPAPSPADRSTTPQQPFDPANPWAATATQPMANYASADAVQQTGDGTGGLIPYKNPKALISYYLGIVSLLPVLGFPFGVTSIVLGIGGLRARSRNPIIKGSVHAIIGIVLGFLGMPLHLLFGAGIFLAILGAAGG